MDFRERYSSLNAAQKQAVDTIDGPVMVIAGPGTGKTELLSVRTANILAKTDTLPENILCLTFTDSGANAMRERLAGIIGKDAYKVAIHTFHSFGTEVINQNGQYFYQGAHFRPADELSSYQIIRTIFEQLDYRNPIAGKMNDDYTYLSESLTTISELKRSGLTSDELLVILDANDAVIEKAEQLLGTVFDTRITKTTTGLLGKHIDTLRQSSDPIDLPTIVPLSTVLADSLESTVAEAEASNSTKPITAWRNQWFKKNEAGEFVMKSRDRQVKLRAISSVYEQYLARMQEAELYDFDDMILRVVHAMEVFDDLRFNLQERYQYIMVDEFQDTNMAQMRILYNLTNNEVQGDTPNILVVGDDDQAIYSFQGADISNIINFRTTYPKANLITLTDNYRSTNDILTTSREVITQGSERLENRIAELNKQLTAHNSERETVVILRVAETITDEREWIAHDIKSRIASGVKPNDIAILTRRHHEIASLLPYLADAGIAVNYERRDNVLELAPIMLIEQLSRVLISLSKGQHDVVNTLLPELLSHKAWGINPTVLWKLSLKAYDSRTRWLDIMAVTPQLAPLHSWLITTAAAVTHTPLEHMLDVIIGNTAIQVADDEKSDADMTEDGPSKHQSIFISPFYEYFFSADMLANNPDYYLRYLEALRTIRAKLREYQPTEIPTLTTFIEFITLHRQLGSTISSIHRPASVESAINVMTAHKSKGLEFKIVYVMNAIDTAWGERARTRGRLISYPENLPLSPAGETSDERLRLFYVAITRAKQQLYMSYSLHDDNGKDTLRAAFLLSDTWQTESITTSRTGDGAIKAAQLEWYQSFVLPKTATMHELLKPTLEHYKLSVTHLHNFLDVTRGGPTTFLLQNLLRFPQAMGPHAAYGSAVHTALQRAHAYLSAHDHKQPVEDILKNFESALADQHMSAIDLEKFSSQGSQTLQTFLAHNYDSFSPSQKAELNFNNQQAIVSEAHLTGSLDLVDIAEDKSITVTDYKTGKPSLTWTGKTEYEKIKLHKYKQQLMFYKLLVEHARDYRGYHVERGVLQFVEPTAKGDIIALDATFDKAELDRFAELMNAVWQHVTTLNLPDISDYNQSLKGILAFEQDLLDKAI